MHTDTPTVLAFASRMAIGSRQELIAAITDVKPATRNAVLSNLDQFLCFPAMSGFDQEGCLAAHSELVKLMKGVDCDYDKC